MNVHLSRSINDNNRWIKQGREDKAVPVDDSKVLNDLWPGSRLVIFEKSGHNPHEEQKNKGLGKIPQPFLFLTGV